MKWFHDLTSVPGFQEFNFTDYGGEPAQAKNPAHEIAEAFRMSRGFEPHPIVAATVRMTLSKECYRLYSSRSELPIDERDYFLSKLYQFFQITAFELTSDPPTMRILSDDLRTVINSTFGRWKPEQLYRLNQIDWNMQLREAKRYDPFGLIAAIGASLPAPHIPTASSARKKPSEAVAGLVRRLIDDQDTFGWPLKTVAPTLGISVSTLSRIVNWKSNPSFGTTKLIENWLRKSKSPDHSGRLGSG